MNTLLGTCLSHDSSGSSSNGSSTAFSFTDSAYASSSSPPSQQPFSNNTTSQSISIMRGLQSQPHQPLPHHHHHQVQQVTKSGLNQSSGHTSILTGLPTSSPSSSLSSVHSGTADHPVSSSLSFFQKQQHDHYNCWNCSVCQEPYKQNRPQILHCFHALCDTCVEKLSDNDEGNLCCPLCGQSTILSEILPDFTVQNHHSNMPNDYMLALGDNVNQGCTACKSTESTAVAKCFQCSGFLCHQCVCAHRIMNCFEGHRVSSFISIRRNRRKSIYSIENRRFFLLPLRESEDERKFI